MSYEKYLIFCAIIFNNNMFGVTMPSAKHSLSIIVLPKLAGYHDIDPQLKNWLARSNLSYDKSSASIINRILYYFNIKEQLYNVGALRFYGETKKKPSKWIAAADPVFVQAHLNRMRIKPINRTQEDMANMVRAYNEINQNLASHYSIELTTNGITGYLQSEIPIPVSMHSPSEISNLAINEVLPKNDKSNIYGQLINEIQMIIHNSDFIDSNLMNSLWVWGGGQLNSLTTHKLPTLYANDPIIKGYWYLSKSNVSSFNKSLEEFCSQERGAFVAVSPDNQVSEISNEEQLRISLSAIHQYQLKFKPERLILIFRDGWTADISTFHKYRVWRNSDFIKKIERNL